MGRITVRIIVEKNNNENVKTVGLIVNSERQNSTVVKSAVARGFDFKS